MTLEERFNKEIDKRNFSFFELTGFQKNPRLAILAGMAIGYKMGTKDITEIIADESKEAE